MGRDFCDVVVESNTNHEDPGLQNFRGLAASHQTGEGHFFPVFFNLVGVFAGNFLALWSHGQGTLENY